MITSDKGLKLLHSFEGLRLRAYFDMVGVATIGWGHTRSVSSDDVYNKRTITEEEANNLFKEDLKIYEKAVSKLAESLTVTQFDALVSFAFNLGTGNLRSMWRGAFMREGLASIPKRMLLYRNAGGKPVSGIIRRRIAEATLFKDGEVRLYNNMRGEMRDLARLKSSAYVKEVNRLFSI